MTEITNCCKNKIIMGAQQTYKNLTMFPLLASYSTPRNGLTIIEPLLKCSTEQNRSAYNTYGIHSSDRISASWDYIEQFARVADQIGAIFLINGILAGMVSFRGPEEFKKSFIKIVECYARKADNEYDPTIDPKSSKSEVINFLKTPIDSGAEIQATPFHVS